MIRFSANLGFLWSDLPLLERIDAAARSGFQAVELHAPFDVAPHVLRARCRDAGVRLLGINTASGSRMGDRGLAAVPGRSAEARALIKAAIDYASEAGGASVHVLAGKVPPSDRAAGREAMLASLAYADPLATQAGLVILLEPLNPVSEPGYFYSRIEEVAAIIAASGATRARLMFDLFHIGMVGETWQDLLEMHFAKVGHVQIASVPDRAEPDHGRLDYRPVMTVLEKLGYAGWVGAEYRPSGDIEAGLNWRERLLA